jgi:hypothetical protein
MKTLQPDKKSVYDAALREQLIASGQLSSEGLPAPTAEEEAADYPPAPPDGFRPGGKRWRTGTEVEAPLPSVGPAPVPIPMPPSAPPPVGSAAPVIRRGASSVSRGKRQSSSAPLLLILGAVGVLAVAVVFAVVMAMKPPALAPNQAKSKSSTEKSSERTPTKNTATHSSSLPATSVQRPPRNQPRSPKSEPIVNRPATNLNPEAPKLLTEPQDELKLAREALGRRNDGDFKLHMGQADYLMSQKKLANADELTAEEAYLKELDKLLSQFWQAVREGADKKIPKGERFKFRKHELELVSFERDQLTYKLDGQEQVAALKKLPARVATSIAYRTIGNEDLSGKIALALFLSVDAEAASDQGSRRLALKLLDDIHKAGEENHPVLTRELGKNSKPMPHADDDFTPPTIVGRSAPPASATPGSAVKKTDAQAFDPMRLKEAREKFERRFRDRMVLALERLELAKPLFTELTEVATGDETAEFKSQVLTQAGELAAQLGDSNGIVKLSEQISALTGENPLEIQLRLFSRCALDGSSAPKDLLKNARTASAQAEAEGNFYAAIELAKFAKKAAEKGGLNSDVESLQEKLQELEKARAGRK